MSKVRVLVGTHKGGFVMTSDERRKDWKIEGPHFAGWDVYHMNGSLADPDRLYADITNRSLATAAESLDLAPHALLHGSATCA